MADMRMKKIKTKSKKKKYPIPQKRWVSEAKRLESIDTLFTSQMQDINRYLVDFAKLAPPLLIPLFIRFMKASRLLEDSWHWIDFMMMEVGPCYRTYLLPDLISFIYRQKMFQRTVSWEVISNYAKDQLKLKTIDRPFPVWKNRRSLFPSIAMKYTSRILLKELFDEFMKNLESCDKYFLTSSMHDSKRIYVIPVSVFKEALGRCRICSKQEGLQRCGRCHLVQYCSLEHQKADATEHDKICLEVDKKVVRLIRKLFQELAVVYSFVHTSDGSLG